MPLQSAFFETDPVTCARNLIGCELTCDHCAGIIVETEAYAVENDPACHTFHRPSAREFVARHPPGTAYVYLNYGMYWLANVLVKSNDQALGFVLIRALQPTRGIDLMRKRRRKEPITELCSGPGKLTIALNINDRDHGSSFTTGTRLAINQLNKPNTILTGPRIGISKAKDLPWRFGLATSPHLSQPFL